MTQSKIAVSELPVSGVQRAEVIRYADKLVLLIDDQPFQIDLNRATALAWSICAQVDAIRTAEIDRSIRERGQEHFHAGAAPLAA
jgi:hypothetical protein